MSRVLNERKDEEKC